MGFVTKFIEIRIYEPSSMSRLGWNQFAMNVEKIVDSETVGLR